MLYQITLMTVYFLVCRRSEYVGESKLATPPAWYQQQLRGYRHPGAFLCSDLYWFWLLSLQTKVCVEKSKPARIPLKCHSAAFQQLKGINSCHCIVVSFLFSINSVQKVKRHC